MRCLAILVAVGCGEAASAGPDASIEPEVGCVTLGHPARFTTSVEFAPAARGTLAGWSPDGRWFLTGTPIAGSSSLHPQRSGPRVVVNRDAGVVATLDDTELFSRREIDDGTGSDRVAALRISNLAPDGTLRAELASCVNRVCQVCTAKLVRASHGLEGEGSRLALVGELADPTWDPGIAFNVRVAGTLAYLVRTDGLHVIETRDPAHPVELGRFRRTGPGYSNDVKLVDAGPRRFALLADTPVHVVDVTDPAAPVLATEILEAAHTLFTETRDGQTLAYLGSYDGACPVYDVTDPARPQKLGSYATGASLLHDLSVEGGVAYLNAWENGFLAVDFTAPSTPQLVGAWRPTPSGTSHSNWTMTAAGRHVALHGDEGYGAHLDVVDVDPASPSFMTSIATWQTRPWISIHNIMAIGTKAYITHYQDGVRVLDLSDPRRPTQIGYYNTWDPQADYTSSAFFEGAVGLDVDLARKLVFVADTPRGLLILRDDTP